MLSNASKAAARRRVLSASCSGARRHLITPSGADRASIVDLPSTFKDDGHFTPRSGEFGRTRVRSVLTRKPDMFGFKIEVPKREGTLKDKTRPIYLDMQVRKDADTCGRNLILFHAQATTPMDPRVLDAMLPYLTDQYGNPHSRTHAYGWEAEKAVDEARKVRFVTPGYRHACSHAYRTLQI